jgi:hypothetical protein
MYYRPSRNCVLSNSVQRRLVGVADLGGVNVMALGVTGARREEDGGEGQLGVLDVIAESQRLLC